jgi:hypothetical protein
MAKKKQWRQCGVSIGGSYQQYRRRKLACQLARRMAAASSASNRQWRGGVSAS